MPLAQLSVAQVQAMFAAIIREHQTLGTPVSASTLNRIRATLRVALNAAIRQGLLSENPARGVELPGPRRPKAGVWTQARIEHWANGPWWRCGRPSSCTPSPATACMRCIT
jgi:site-specific recombinase XerC